MISFGSGEDHRYVGTCRIVVLSVQLDEYGIKGNQSTHLDNIKRRGDYRTRHPAKTRLRKISALPGSRAEPAPHLPAAECFHPCNAFFFCRGDTVEGGVFDSGAGEGVPEELEEERVEDDDQEPR